MASKKLRSAQLEGGDDCQVDMSPMIDMVFLLLIFFLVNATLIIVEMDKKITVPIARHSDPQKEKLGRIVINVYGDKHVAKGRFRDAMGTKAFPDDEALKDYIEKERQAAEQKGHTARLHLRADEGVHFTYVRRAIRAAAKAGVNEVIFVTIERRQD
jgi:biopolymer transport protein ExbD